MLISSVFILLVSLCFSLFCTLAVVGFDTHLVNGFGVFSVFYFACEHESLNMSVVLDCLYCITVFLC